MTLSEARSAKCQTDPTFTLPRSFFNSPVRANALLSCRSKIRAEHCTRPAGPAIKKRPSGEKSILAAPGLP